MMVRTNKQPMTPARLLMPLLWMLMAFYGGYHALHGERGLYALWHDQRELAKHGITCSMSRRGNCYDNAPMESFLPA